MIIPYSENIECSALICALHSLTNQYKYKAYIVKQFPRLVNYPTLKGKASKEMGFAPFNY